MLCSPNEGSITIYFRLFIRAVKGLQSSQDRKKAVHIVILTKKGEEVFMIPLTITFSTPR